MGKALCSLLKQLKAWLQLLGMVCGMRVKREVELTLSLIKMKFQLSPTMESPFSSSQNQ